ncbi:MAG: hypothetical protein RLZZ67_175, partial [Candidatus Parcubacteria bacterium]
MANNLRIGVLGMWHLGEIYSACLADIGHDVVGICDSTKTVQDFKKSIPPLAEPLLADLLQKNQSKKTLTYTTSYSAIKKVDVLWFAFDIPVNDEDEVDLKPLWSSLKKAVPYLSNGVTVAVSSQLPVGTSKKIQEFIKKERPRLVFSYFYSPENLRLGEGVTSFMDPKRVVVGADASETFEVARKIFKPLSAEIVTMGTSSAEMAKHAVNAWLATSISFTNDLADACEHTGADIEDVIKALKAEPRVGQKAYLFAGLGFSGGTLGRDLKALMALTSKNDLELPLISSVYEKNRKRSSLVHKRLKYHFGVLKGKKFAVFGVTYKPGTSTLRRSMPLHIERFLRKEGAIMRLADSHA